MANKNVLRFPYLETPTSVREEQPGASFTDRVWLDLRGGVRRITVNGPSVGKWSVILTDTAVAEFDTKEAAISEGERLVDLVENARY